MGHIPGEKYSEMHQLYVDDVISKDEFLADSNNMVICDWGTIFEIEPAIAPIFELPIGTELTLEYDGSKKYFVNSETGEKIIF